MIEFQMPSLGADMEDGTLIEWKKKPGDFVKRGDIIAEVDTQKGLIEIEVFDEGIITELLIQERTKVPVGTPMALIQPSGIEVEKPVELHPIMEKTPVPITEYESETVFVKASPLAKKMATENHIDLSKIKGSGPDSAITKDDIDAIIKLQETKTEQINTPTESIRMAVAAAMSKSNREIPHYYLEKKIDMTKTLAWLQEVNKQRTVANRLLPVVLFIKAMAKSLKEFPDLNAVWENGLFQKTEINIGFVVSLRNGGIIVPTIPQPDTKSADEIMAALNDLIPRARALKLRSSELSSSTITLTNLGDAGCDTVFGIIYPPQVAIVGFGSISEQPFAENGMLGIRAMADVTLAGDHRATDGLTGSRFLSILDKHLQNPEAL